MTRVVTELAPKDRPFGVDFLWDPRAALNIAAATGGSFIRCVPVGAYEIDMGLWSTDVAGLLRERRRIGADGVATFMNVTPEFASSLGTRSVTEVARSAVWSSLADAILISGPRQATEPDMDAAGAVKETLGGRGAGLRQHRRQGRQRGVVPGEGRRHHRRLRPQARRLHVERGRRRPRRRVHGAPPDAGRSASARMSVLLGIDVGTTGTKALLLDPREGRDRRGRASQPAALASIPGWAEEDTGRVVGQRLRHHARAARRASRWPASASPAWCPAPSRSTSAASRCAGRSSRTTPARCDEVEELNRRLAGTGVLERTGSAITQQSTGPRLLWLAEHEPEVWGRTRTLIGLLRLHHDAAQRLAHRRGQLGPRDRPARLRLHDAGPTTCWRRAAAARSCCRRSAAATRSSAP